jgi:hypothetical protein
MRLRRLSCRRRSKRTIAVLVALPLAIAAGLGAPPARTAGATAEAVDGVLHATNEGAPAEGRQVLQLEEIWRRGGGDDEIFFGSIAQALIDAEGNVYVLDQQLSQVEVFAADGAHLRTLSREGEGPGEVRRPEDMLFLPDGSLGLVQYFNGRIVKIDRDGTPAGAILPPGAGTGGGRPSIRRARHRNGHFVVNGARMVPDENGMQRTQYIAAWTAEGEEITSYLTTTRTVQLRTEGWIEKNQYFPESERWALGPDGRVYLAGERDDYEISVYAPDGTLERTISRPLTGRLRSEDEKQDVREGLVVIRGGQRMQIPVEVEDREPAISELWVHDDGTLWVLPSANERDQPDGVMQTYDVFDAQGRYLREVAIACEGDPVSDRLLMPAAGRMVLIRGAREARRNMFGGSGDVADEGVAEHEIVVFRHEPL